MLFVVPNARVIKCAPKLPWFVGAPCRFYLPLLTFSFLHYAWCCGARKCCKQMAWGISVNTACHNGRGARRLTVQRSLPQQVFTAKLDTNSTAWQCPNTSLLWLWVSLSSDTWLKMIPKNVRKGVQIGNNRACCVVSLLVNNETHVRCNFSVGLIECDSSSSCISELEVTSTS